MSAEAGSEPPRVVERLARAWARVPAADAGVYALVAALLLAALVAPPLWTSAQPAMEVRRRYLASGGRDEQDPWGRPLLHPAARLGDPSQAGGWPYSAGPNGVDEAGQGDDVTLSPEGPLDQLYATLRELLLVCCAGVAGLWELARWVRRQLALPRDEALGPELTRAAGLALPFGVVLALAAQWVLWRFGGLLAPIQDALLVPLPYALAGSAYLVSFLLVLWLRLR